MKKLVLVDGNSVAFRAFHALPLLTNDKGVYTNAVYGFTTMLLKVLEEEKPSHMLVAFDAGKTTFRHGTFEEYKSGREKTPHELSEQLPLLRKLLDTFRLSHVEVDQYEADDIIGTLAKQAEAEDFTVRIFSGDKDLLQLVTEKTTVSLTRKGMTNLDTYDVKAFKERYELTPLQLIDMKGLMGDSSDNIPGVPGVGEKTAIKLLKEYDSLENVLANIENISGKKLKERLTENQEQAKMSRELATILTEAPVPTKVTDTGYEGYDAGEVYRLFKELEFNSLLQSIDDSGETEKKELSPLDFTIVETVEESIFQSPSALLVEVPHENYHNGDIWGIAIVNEMGKYYIDVETALTSEVFREWAEDETQFKQVFDAKRAFVSLGWRGIQLRGVNFDALIASYLIDPSSSSHALTAIAERKEIPAPYHDDEVYGKGAKQTTPEREILAEHLARKADTLKQLAPLLNEELETNEQSVLFKKLEMPLSIILAKMETYGVQLDVGQLEKMGKELEQKLAELEGEIHELAGESFNINSPKQLGPILFEKLELPVLKKTKTGYSTSADILEKLANEHEIIPKLLHYRQVSKLKSTYIEGLLKVVHPETSKIHTMFNQALTQTGRLSSAEPNLQNIPIRLEEGRKIRKAFVPSEQGWSMLAADYSQIELRVLAHISKDERLVSAFNEERDIHTKTAMDVYQVKEDEVTSEMRRNAKAVNFGIVYGISDYGLSQTLGITRKQAKAYIDAYFESYPQVQNYMTEAIDEAREKGYVTTQMHRRRYLPEITSSNFNRRSFAERTAMNTPIQGTAADIIKKAMVDLEYVLLEENLRSRLLLQVHDELIFEVPEDELERMKHLVPQVMEQTTDLDVPLKADVSYGPSWFEAK
ncbi:DNA polymerase I [Salsuginibacillus kocurii]|uniref:DNA polymerase I n=1 Tax=Salsuginibacillus kocurii TaxID=427078 RepID=UPI000366035F|nr:DNA polymerase I [Salsuginibacillus kocurii]